jgi:hypothetical protein
MSQENICYIRREDGNGWTRGKIHHFEALTRFLNTPNNSNHVEVRVPHEQGGDFVAYFSRYASEEQNNTNTFCFYVDEYRRRVDIMLCSSAYAAYINRLTF